MSVLKIASILIGIVGLCLIIGSYFVAPSYQDIRGAEDKLDKYDYGSRQYSSAAEDTESIYVRTDASNTMIHVGFGALLLSIAIGVASTRRNR